MYIYKKLITNAMILECKFLMIDIEIALQHHIDWEQAKDNFSHRNHLDNH